MTALPNYFHLVGDETGGVTFECQHSAHSCGLAYYGGHGQKDTAGLLYYRKHQLGDFLTFIADHAASHRDANADLDWPNVRNWRDVRTGSYEAWKSYADQHGIRYPAGATRVRLAQIVKGWLETNR